MIEPEPGEHVRRLSAAMRFLSQLHGIGTEADLIQAVIQAAAVWYDLDARAYRRDLRGVDKLDTWLPGAELDADPRQLTAGALVSPGQVTRISSMADFEQLGWPNAQREVALLPIAPNGRICWLLVVPGMISREVEATLMLVCRTAASVLEQLVSQKAREVCDRLAVSLAQANGAVTPVAEALLGELMTATGALRGTLAIRRSVADEGVVLAARGYVGRPEARFDLGAGQAVLEPGRLAIAQGLGGGADALIDLGAGLTTEFDVTSALLAEAGASVVRAWLAGVALGERRATVSERQEASPAPPFEKSIGEEVGRARRLQLKGGVVVLSIEAREAAGDIQARGLLIQALRSEIRSSDLLGQLTTGELAALLVRANEAGVAAAKKRLRQRIDRLAREHGLPAVALGSTLYPPPEGDTPGMLLNRARTAAAQTGETGFFN